MPEEVGAGTVDGHGRNPLSGVGCAGYNFGLVLPDRPLSEPEKTMMKPFPAVRRLPRAGLCRPSPSAAKGDAEKGKALFYTCTGCHGIADYKKRLPHLPRAQGGRPERAVPDHRRSRHYKKGERNAPDHARPGRKACHRPGHRRHLGRLSVQPEERQVRASTMIPDAHRPPALALVRPRRPAGVCRRPVKGNVAAGAEKAKTCAVLPRRHRQRKPGRHLPQAGRPAPGVPGQGPARLQVGQARPNAIMAGMAPRA